MCLFYCNKVPPDLNRNEAMEHTCMSATGIFTESIFFIKPGAEEAHSSGVETSCNKYQINTSTAFFMFAH